MCGTPLFAALQNELAVLEFIHCMVETFDKWFHNVCELDIMFSLETVGRVHGMVGWAMHLCDHVAMHACPGWVASTSWASETFSETAGNLSLLSRALMGNHSNSFPELLRFTAIGPKNCRAGTAYCCD